ncbi:MAG: aspartate--tRNA ligase [Alphaproteobacteria bacterium]|nr:MAG: aspartate--tRNA ligase [Alphaproteobacteria bacterium]
MHPYRSHCCHELRASHVNQTVRLSGWIHNKRDHGDLIFLDIRDHFGLTQCVVEAGNPHFNLLEGARIESVITVTGIVAAREKGTENPDIPTGQVEVKVSDVVIESEAKVLPFQISVDEPINEELRLKHRFLDLRRDGLHKRIQLRSHIISSIRQRMVNQGFTEFQTPILTASSPEGARDYLVPSRVHPGTFYALPQAPQQFKQLLMMSGFDRYFQIAPCFRDEDARADRSPGEFYQLDFEMSFVTQDDVFAAIEPVLQGIFEEFSSKKVTQAPFPRITYHDAMLHYGSDKPDLRNPLVITDVTTVFTDSDFGVFAKSVAQGMVVRAIPAPHTAQQPRSFFDKMNEWARGQGAPGLGYITFENGVAKGPIAKFLDEARLQKLKEIAKLGNNDSVFFACGKEAEAAKLAGTARTKLGTELGLIPNDRFDFCWIVDFPMYEYNEDLKKIDFSHNPFSMPQGGMDALEGQDPLAIKAFQYDIVCNGTELSSGAIRNHKPDIMLKAFEIAGYPASEVEARFGGMINAMRYGAPPHGGSAPGIDRIVMLLADVENLREIVAFPMNQKAQDLMMGAPSTVSEKQLKELHIKLDPPVGSHKTTQ